MTVRLGILAQLEAVPGKRGTGRVPAGRPRARGGRAGHRDLVRVQDQ